MMDILEKLFGTAAKVKIMRLFLFNPTSTFDLQQISHRSKVTPQATRREIINLHKIGLIKRKSFYREFVRGKGKRKKIER